MTSLLGPDGRPISSKSLQNKKAPPPKLGEGYAAGWTGEDVKFLQLPGGGALQLNLDALTLSDFRQMKDHYQINSSLSVLTFMMHQMEWHIDCEDEKQRDFYEESLNNVWTTLVRAMSQAFWAGYSPNILQWDNDTPARRVVLDKIKDIFPEDAKVHWKQVEGFSSEGADQTGITRVRPKVKIYDGIDQFGFGHVPVGNTFWYPLLMENGNYYGRKLLRPAFTSWFFSILLHLFANRYYERFGEPTPVGRAPFDEQFTIDGQEVSGRNLMVDVITQLRNRGVVLLPNDKTPFGDETNPGYDYTLEYLESQMRGADFERYMTRLDEEMSLALFTPILLLRTADVGSYNLGTQHTQTYLWMLNAISGDWATYINKYMLRPMRDYNFGTNAAMPKIKFRRTGKENRDLVRDIVVKLLETGKMSADVRELGEMTGMTFDQIKTLTGDGPQQQADPSQEDGDTPGQTDQQGGQNLGGIFGVADQICNRVENQVKNAFKKDQFNSDLRLSMGYRRQLQDAAEEAGIDSPISYTARIYAVMDEWLKDIAISGNVDNTADFMKNFKSVLYSMIRR